MEKRHDCQATKKGDLSNCNNWRGIRQLSVPGEVLCSILLNRLKDNLDKRLQEEQVGFQSGRSCSEQILTLRNIIEQRCEYNQKVLINFVDFSVENSRDLWHTRKVHQYLQKLYLNSSCCIRTNSGHTDYFNIITGVCQGCIISPLLFLLTIDFAVRQATSDPQHGIPWNTRRFHR